ncbi:MAG TPA: hypothetical protein VNS50_02540 [Ginsengibacter sp.]|nr:hypothetical protein [Ginsengibacter sp.]
MKKIFLFRLIAILLMCFSSLLIKSENIACKIKCTAFSSCPIQQEKISSNTHGIYFYNDDGLFIKI